MNKGVIIDCDDADLARKIIIRKLLKERIFFIVDNDVLVIIKGNIRISFQERPKLSELVQVMIKTGEKIELDENPRFLKFMKEELIKPIDLNEFIIIDDKKIKYDKHQIKSDNVKNMQKIKQYKKK